MQEEMQGFVWRGAGFSLPAQVPGCVSDALCAAGIVPPPDVGLNALRGEWAAAREWTLCGRIALPQGRERVFLRARGVHGAGVLLAAGREVGRFAQGDWETEITEFIGAEADSVQIGLRFFARPAEGVPRRALVGVRGGLDAFGVNRLRFEDCYACAAVRDGVSTAEFRMTVRPFVPGRYTFRFAAVYGGETLACCEFAEDLRAVRTEIRKTLAVPSPRIWHAAEKNEPVWLRATVLSAGLVCDDHLARTGFRTAEANADARLSVNGERILLRGARWRCGEPVAWARQKRRLEALRACGLNCLQTEGLAGDALLSWLDAHGMLCVCVLPGDETAAAQIVRRAREHPCVVAYCGQSAAVCRALDGDRPFLGALFAPIGCAAVHGNLAALRGDAEDAPFRAEREAARYADEGTQGGKDAACVENENRDGGFSQATETLPCFDVLSSGAETESFSAPISRYMQTEAPNEYLHGKDGVNETVHFAAGEMCGGVGAGSSAESPAAALTSRFTPSETSYEYIGDARMYEKVAENETVHFAAGETSGGVGAGSNDEHSIAAPTLRFTPSGTSYEYIEDARMCIYEKVAENETVHFSTDEMCGGVGAGSNDEHPIAAPTSRFTLAGTSYEYIGDARMCMYEKVAENETAHFAASKTSGGFGEMSGGVQPLAMPVSRFEWMKPLYECAENQSRKNAFSQATETPPRFGIPNSGTETAPLSLPTSRFTVPAPPPPSDTPIREKTPHSQETFPLPAETLRRFGIPNSGAETVPLSPQTLPFTPSDPPSPPPDDMPMHEKPPHSEETFSLPAETRRRFGILGSEAEALAAPISRYVQAETLRERVENARMRGENILLAEPFETVESPRSAALFDGERPRPAFFAVESALRPAHVCARMERTGYPCGAPMEAEIWLLYDAKTVPGPLRVSAVLCDGTGREIARAVFDASPRTGVVGRFRAKMPDVPGALILRVRLDALGEMLDVSDTIVCAALNAPMWPLAHAPYAAVRIENGEIRNACARAAYGVACGGYLNAAWPGWGALLPGECRAVRDETRAEALNMEPKMK